MDIDSDEFLKYFVDFSETATGFSASHLLESKQVEIYFRTVRAMLGDQIVSEFLLTFHRDGFNRLFTSEKLGPIARNIVKLWYVATWEQLPSGWNEKYGPVANDALFIVSPTAYTEGLLWQAIGVNPPGAKMPGYGTWSMAPASTLKRQ